MPRSGRVRTRSNLTATPSNSAGLFLLPTEGSDSEGGEDEGVGGEDRQGCEAGEVTGDGVVEGLDRRAGGSLLHHGAQQGGHERQGPPESGAECQGEEQDAADGPCGLGGGCAGGDQQAEGE